MFGPDSPLLALRRQPMQAAAVRPTVERFAFQISLVGGQPFLQTVDARGKRVDPDYRSESGPARILLKAIADARAADAETIAWGESGELQEAVALSGRSDLIELLLRCNAVVDAKLNPIGMELQPEHTVGLQVTADSAPGMWQSHLIVRTPGSAATAVPGAALLADGYLLTHNALKRCTPLGSAWALLPAFAQRFSQSDLGPLLTLFASAFPDALLDVPGFAINNGDPLDAQLALLFEEVDEDDCLHIAFAESVGRLPVDFVREYDVATVAHIDQEAHCIRLRPVNYAPAINARHALQQKLLKMGRGHGDKNTFMVDAGDGRFMLSKEMALAFLRSELPTLTSEVKLLGTDRLGKYRVVHSTPKLSVKLSHGIDFLDGDANLEIEGEQFSLMDALSLYQKSRYIPLTDGRQAIVDADIMARMERLFRKRKQGVRVSFFDLPLIEELIGEAAAEATLPDARSVFAGFNDIPKRKIPLRNFTGTLRPYQLAGLKWLDYLHAHQLGGCLADDMGLGKTVQTIALLSRIKIPANKPVLVVMPRSLLFNWSRELEAFAPKLRFHVFHGSGRDWEKARAAQVILTTYGTVRSDLEAIAQQAFTAVILDESQAIKNPSTQASKAVCALKAKFRLALSGTPVENHLGELYALFRFLNPAMFHSAADFERSYARPIQNDNDPQAAHDLRKRVFPFILRRLKGDVLKDLPPKVEQVLYVEMSPEQKAYYERRRRFHQTLVNNELERSGIAASRFMVLEAMLELRQIASVPESRTDGAIVSAKRERLLEALSEAVENGHKCLVFCNFLAGVEAVCEDLHAAGFAHERMTGSTVDRQQRVERFQNDPAIKAFVMTLKTGGLGLNLTAADTVFIMDPWWNTSAEAQAVDRAHRIGQANRVFTYRLIARDSIEEKIRLLQQKKLELVDRVLATDENAFKSLSKEDIELLFNA